MFTLSRELVLGGPASRRSAVSLPGRFAPSMYLLTLSPAIPVLGPAVSRVLVDRENAGTNVHTNQGASTGMIGAIAISALPAEGAVNGR